MRNVVVVGWISNATIASGHATITMGGGGGSCLIVRGHGGGLGCDPMQSLGRRAPRTPPIRRLARALRAGGPCRCRLFPRSRRIAHSRSATLRPVPPAPLPGLRALVAALRPKDAHSPTPSRAIPQDPQNHSLGMRLGLAPMRGGPSESSLYDERIASPRRSHRTAPGAGMQGQGRSHVKHQRHAPVPKAHVVTAATPLGVRGKPPTGRRRLRPRRRPWRSRQGPEEDGSDECS